MEFLRTPEERFADLPDFPWEPHYTLLDRFDDLRLHYVDTGEGDTTFLCLHGEPTWSFLYRKMIPVFEEVGRVVAPDFYGFGRSDKPVDDAAYTFGFHRRTLLRFVHALDLRHITLVCQDWGGLLGLTLPMEMSDRFDRLLVMNTTLATGVPPSDGFVQWQQYNRSQPDLAVGKLLGRAVPHLTDAEKAAYDAPFPDAHYKAGVRSFPEIVPTRPDMPGAAVSRDAAKWLSTEWSGRSFLALGARDPVLGASSMKYLHKVIRHAPEPHVVERAGHFLQEWGEQVARAAVSALY